MAIKRCKEDRKAKKSFEVLKAYLDSHIKHETVEMFRLRVRGHAEYHIVIGVDNSYVTDDMECASYFIDFMLSDFEKDKEMLDYVTFTVIALLEYQKEKLQELVKTNFNKINNFDRAEIEWEWD